MKRPMKRVLYIWEENTDKSRKEKYDSQSYVLECLKRIVLSNGQIIWGPELKLRQYILLQYLQWTSLHNIQLLL